MMYYKPTPLFRADVRKIAHGLIIRTIRYNPNIIYRIAGILRGGLIFAIFAVGQRP